ncbi:hypothetical protein CPB83DRAFT_901954 [Crepidotus variabilis]|uniref:NmrA-like domain-containing protein n=1 Tax=Crepidotus variabilis TaxID=179855 RepID=A0A9P6ETT2_9AGAR|nr:hypothetical protein CPB83DRAFT_901954 [Crepidotus variabilis]
MSTTPIKRVLIAGASGNLGPAIVDELLAAKIFEVAVLARLDSKATFPSKVEVFRTDYSLNSLNEALAQAKPDAVVSALDAVDSKIADLQTNLIEAAKTNGVKRFIPSEFGADSTNPEVVRLVPIYEIKRKATAHLKRLESDVFSWTAIVTGPFFDWGIKADFIAIDKKEKKLFRWDDGNAPFSVVTLATIGKSVASLLSDSAKLSATANKYIFLASYTITLNEYFEAIQKATPGVKWVIENIDSDAVLEKSMPAYREGNVYAAFDLLKAVVFGKRALNQLESKSDHKLLGLQPAGDLLSDVKAALGPSSS